MEAHHDLNYWRPTYTKRISEQHVRAQAERRQIERRLKMRRAAVASRNRQIEALPETMRWERVLKRVCRATGITKQEMLGPSRKPHIVFARFMAQYWLARLTKMSMAHIAKRMNRDHTTVLTAVKVYREKRARMGRNLPRARAPK